jgi:hypothetical protein
MFMEIFSNMEEFYEFFVLNEAVQEEDLEEGEILSEPEDQIVPILENIPDQPEQIQDQMVPVQVSRLLKGRCTL